MAALWTTMLVLLASTSSDQQYTSVDGMVNPTEFKSDHGQTRWAVTFSSWPYHGWRSAPNFQFFSCHAFLQADWMGLLWPSRSRWASVWLYWAKFCVHLWMSHSAGPTYLWWQGTQVYSQTCIWTSALMALLDSQKKRGNPLKLIRTLPWKIHAKRIYPPSDTSNSVLPCVAVKCCNDGPCHILQTINIHKWCG